MGKPKKIALKMPEVNSLPGEKTESLAFVKTNKWKTLLVKLLLFPF